MRYCGDGREESHGEGTEGAVARPDAGGADRSAAHHPGKQRASGSGPTCPGTPCGGAGTAACTGSTTGRLAQRQYCCWASAALQPARHDGTLDRDGSGTQSHLRWFRPAIPCPRPSQGPRRSPKSWLPCPPGGRTWQPRPVATGGSTPSVGKAWPCRSPGGVLRSSARLRPTIPGRTPGRYSSLFAPPVLS
jgi:hypothetical protein